MIAKIYKTLRIAGWSSKDVTQDNNQRMGITKCFVKDNKYCEIYKESYGYSVHLYGAGFMNGYFPSVIDVLGKEDIDILMLKLNK